jgi:hypothetical protein
VLEQRETNGINRNSTVRLKITLGIGECARAKDLLSLERQFTGWHVATIAVLEDGEAIQTTGGGDTPHREFRLVDRPLYGVCYRE